MNFTKLLVLGLAFMIVGTASSSRADFFSRSLVGSWRCVNYPECWLDLRKDGKAFGVFERHPSPRDEMQWVKAENGSVTLSSGFGGGFSATLTVEDDDLVYRAHRFRRAGK